MDRLIDADELHEIINWTHMKPPFSKKAVHRYIDMARTVEAIPISWLQTKADSWNAELKNACPEDAETIRHIQDKYLGIIEEWRKEE